MESVAELGAQGPLAHSGVFFAGGVVRGYTLGVGDILAFSAVFLAQGLRCSLFSPCFAVVCARAPRESCRFAEMDP